MDQAQLRQLIPPKQQNPLLKRKPLNLGTKFNNYLRGEATINIQQPLSQPNLTILFFAAEWCNITKTFVPILKNFYQQVNLQSKKVQIIYVPFDKSKKQYDSFTKSMPWISIPFGDQRPAGLKQFYDIRQIPKILLLDIRGQQVIHKCRDDLYKMHPDDVLSKWQELKKIQQAKYQNQKKSTNEIKQP